MSNFSENLRHFRKERKLTQVALAEKINTGYTTISMLESERYMPNSDIVEALAKALGVTIDDLFNNSD